MIQHPYSKYGHGITYLIIDSTLTHFHIQLWLILDELLHSNHEVLLTTFVNFRRGYLAIEYSVINFRTQVKVPGISIINFD